MPNSKDREIKDIDSLHQKIDRILAILEKQSEGHHVKVDVQKNSKGKVVAAAYNGVRGGVMLLVDEGFFSTPRSFPTVVDELKTRGYHYPRTSVQPVLSSLIRPGYPLVRLKGEDGYVYAIRK